VSHVSSIYLCSPVRWPGHAPGYVCRCPWCSPHRSAPAACPLHPCRQSSKHTDFEEHNFSHKLLDFDRPASQQELRCTEQTQLLLRVIMTSTRQRLCSRVQAVCSENPAQYAHLVEHLELSNNCCTCSQVSQAGQYLCTSKRVMVTGLAGRSTVSPARANSCSRLPCVGEGGPGGWVDRGQGGGRRSGGHQ
jgi:hypothetical protein